MSWSDDTRQHRARPPVVTVVERQSSTQSRDSIPLSDERAYEEEAKKAAQAVLILSHLLARKAQDVREHDDNDEKT